jgi:hypothetical protein
MFKALFGMFSNFLGPKARLIIEYMLIAMLLAALGLSVTLYISKLKQDVVVEGLHSDVTSLNGEVGSLKTLNEFHKADIQELKELRYLDADVLGKLVNEMNALSNRDAEFRAKLGRLEEADETVRTYLNSPLPPQLRCMLERTCESPASDGVPKAGTGAVQPTGKVHGPNP